MARAWIPYGWLYGPEPLRMGLEGQDLYLRALAWSAQHGTDGHVPAAQIRVLSPFCADAGAVADRLVSLGCWDRTDEGYYIPQWHEFHKSREEWQLIIEQRRRAGLTSGRKRRANRTARQTDRPRDVERIADGTGSGEGVGIGEGIGTGAGARRQERSELSRSSQSEPTPSDPSRLHPSAHRGVSGLVDAYRALPGVAASDQDSAVIAQLVDRHGAARVKDALDHARLGIAAADNPLQHLRACVERRTASVMPADRRDEIMETLRAAGVQPIVEGLAERLRMDRPAGDRPARASAERGEGDAEL